MSRNRTAGHNYERQIVKELKERGYSAVTSRAESRNMDNRGVDIFTDLNNLEGKELPVHIQCKNKTNQFNVGDILGSDALPTNKPTVIFHKKTKKATSKFVTEGEFVYMTKEAFYELLLK